MTTPTITELYAQIGAMMANWQRFLDQQMGWQAGPSSANDLSPPDNNPANKGYRVMLDAAGNKRQIMTPSQMEKLVADAVKQIDDLNPVGLGAQLTEVRADADRIAATLSSSRAELTALVDSATSSKNAAASSATAASSSKTAAASSATAAASSATSASSSKTAAASSATAAAASQGVATTKASESQASAAESANKAADAAVSASTASTKAGEASASASTASTKAGEAASSATAAASSATAAASSATAAAGSASAAKTSETNANTKASAAATSAVSAQKWADNAVDSAVTTGKFSALHHATKASESAAAAAASANTSLAKASEASGHASSASTSASTATTKAGEAATGASTATTKAAAAASSATSAANSATAAANSATAAANSATAASNSASSASSSKTAAASSAADAAASAQAAREAMYVSTGALIEAGEIDMSGGTYPAPLTDAAGKDLACFWKVTTAGISSLDGVDYEVGDTLVYSSASKKFYKIDNTESVQSVNGMKGAVRLTAADVGALAATATAAAAAKLATARTITIAGDGTGSASFDGTSNVSINLTVTDDSHAHTFANLKNRPTTLAGFGITDAATSSHVHADLFSKSGGSITGQTLVNIASGPTIGGTSFDNGWLKIGSSSAGIAFDPNEIAVSGNDLSFGTITNNIVSLVVNNVRVGEMRADGLYSMNSKVLTEAAGSAVSAGKLATARALALTGDATGSLTFDGSADASMAVTLANSGVTAGTFTKVTVDAKGRVTAATTQTAADIPALDWSKITSGKPTNLTGYGVSSATLKAIEGLAMAADKAIYFTAAGTAAVMTMTGAARALLDDADSAAMRATLGAASTSAATTTANGLMSAADKAKLDSVQASANAYVHPASGVAAGSYRTVTVDANGHVTGGSNPTTLNDYGITDAAPSSHVGAGGTAHASATSSMSGFMSAADKAKLDGIGAGANNYTHPTGDGNLHVPATGSTSNGKVLKAGATAGSFSWASLTPDDVGLSNVNNWPFSTTTNDPSDTTYATAGAVKRAADIANAALPKAGGSLTGSVTFTNDSVLQWSRNTDAAAIGFKNSADSDVDSFMWFRTSDNGNEYFKWQSVNGSTTTDLMTLKSDNLRIKGDQVYHQGFKPTPAEIGAAATDHAHTYSLRDIKDSPYKEGCDCATTANLAGTYVNGSSGVGATLTNSSTLAALAIDGVAVTVGMRVLVKNQTAAAQNGIYTVTKAGSATEAWVLTRTPGCDTSAEAAGAVVTVDQGTANGGLLMTTEFKRNGVIGTTAMNWRVVVDAGNIGAQHHNSGATAGTYRSVTVNAQGHVTAGTNPTTLAGYGITDALGLNANAVSATKLATARTLTVGGTGKAFDGTANLSWSLAEIGAMPAAGGGIAGDFWRAVGDRQFGLVEHLGSNTDAKACLVLLAKKYVGTLLNKTGFVGRILFSRGSVGSLNYTDFVDVSVTVAYNGNLVRLQRRSGATVAAAKIVEVTYNSEVYYALYRPVSSAGEVVATGHAFNAALPLLIPDATAYTITDVVTNEEDYHAGNKPTAKDLNVVDRSGDTMTGDLVNSRRFIITDANGPSSQFEARNGDMMAIFRTSGGGAILGAQTGGAWDGYIKVGKDAGFSYTPKGGSTEFQVYHQGFKPTPADVGALASGGTAVNAGGVKLNYRWSTSEHDFNDGGNTDQDLKFYWHGSANVNGPTDGSGAKTSGYGITYGNGVHGGQFELGYGSWPQFRSLINGNWSEWNKLYHTGFKPTPADVGALPVNANAVSATKLATARTINGTNFDGTGNITTVNWGTARTLTIGNSGKSVNGDADVSWSLAEIGAARARGELASGATENITTAQFVQWLKDSGAFDERVWIARGSWSYANNKTITDTGCGNIHLAGCTIEVISGSEFAFTIRIITPTTTSGGGTTGAEFVYVNNGSAYLPGWRRIYTTAWKPNADDVGALPSGGTAVAATKLATSRQINGTNFDGTGNITTVNWGAARTLTIGNTAKSVNGSADVSWSLDEIGAARAMPLKLGSADGKPRSSRLLSIAKTDSSCSFVISSQGDFGNRSRGWYQVSVATRGSLITVDAYSLNAKDSADPLKLFAVDTGSVFEVWGEFSDYNNDSSVLICSSHGAIFWGDQMTSAKDWTGFSRIAINRIYTSNDKPTPADLGLGSLNNWEASSAVNDASDTKYATAGAVKKAYDLAAEALPKAGGVVTDVIRFTGASGGISIHPTSDNSTGIFNGTGDGAAQDKTNIQIKSWYGIGICPTAGSSLAAGLNSLWINARTGDVWTIGELYAKTDKKVYHQGFKPTPADVGALPVDANAVSATKLATARTISATGDATGSASFDGSANAAIALTLANSGVTAGTYGKVTVDAKGRVTAGLAMVAADIPSLDWSKISSGKPTTLAGYGITDAQAKHPNLAALAGFTPAADRIPYFTSASAASVTPLTAFARSLLDDNDAAAARATLGVLSIEEPFKSAADVATTANLGATYANGSSGVGATLTASAAAALVLDGVTCSVGMRVLVKNQTAAAQNGVYTVTNAGSSTVAWVLTRATDADTTAKLAGAVVTVDQGTSNGSMLLTNDWKKTGVVGTTAMNWRVVIDSGNVSSYHHNSGVTAGTYRSVTVNAQGHVTGGSNPTTLSGYGITDAAPSSHVGSGGGAHATATTAAHGFMSNTDKAKLDSIASNANNYAHPTGDGNLHVPATGTSNNGKYLMAGATAGSLSWQSIDAAEVGAVPVSGGSMSGVLTVNNEIRTTSANSMRMVYGNYGTFWRQDGANMYLMFTNAGDQYGSYNSLRPMSANLANGSVNFGHAVDVAGNLSVNTGSTSWIDMRASAAFQSRSAVATASASAIVRQEHADRHFILGGLGNSCFGVFMINKSRTVNGTDAGAYLSADGTWYCNGNVSANDYQVRSDRRLKSEFTEIKDAWDLWKTLQISEYTKEGAREYGFIAQDFEKNHKPAVAMTSTSEYLNLKPMSVLAIAGKVIQSLQDRVEKLENMLNECMKRMEVGDASTS